MSRSAPLTGILPDDFDGFIRDCVAAGRFASAADAIREAMALLERQGRQGEATREDLRREILLGIEQVESGQVRDGDIVFREVRRKLGLA